MDQVLLPTQAKGLAAGGEAALIQWLVAWAQSPGTFILRTFATSVDDPQLERLSRRLYGLVAALCCDSALNYRGDTDITGALASLALSQLEALQGHSPRSASRGQSVEILCVDHLGRSAPKLLYQRDANGMSKVRPRNDFADVAAMVLDVTVQGGYRRNVSSSAANAFAEMLFEIFRNTEDHARTSLDQNELRRSVRGFQARTHGLLPGALNEIVGDFVPLRTFCERLQPDPGSRQVHLMELSVFDSGIGFAQSWTKKKLSDMTLQEERDAVEECFSKKSSKPNRGFGEGLPHVIRLLQKQGGFLRLRTGRLSLYADMGRAADVVDAVPFELQPWVPDDEEPLHEAAGALLTVLMPLRRVV